MLRMSPCETGLEGRKAVKAFEWIFKNIYLNPLRG